MSEQPAGRLAAGQLDVLRPGFVRVVAPNASFMTGPGTNSYLFGDRQGVALVDPGPDDAAHRSLLLASAPGPVRYVLVTHHHRDHAPGAAAIAAIEGATVLAFGKPGVLEPAAELRDGDVVVVPGWRLTAVETPGHASDHLCFLAEPLPTDAPGLPGAGASAAAELSMRGSLAASAVMPVPAAAESAPVLLSGDHVLSGTTVVVPPPDGDMTAYLDSLRRLADLRPAPRAIAPGHGGLIEDPAGVIAFYLKHRLEREQQVLAGLRQMGPASVEQLVDGIYTRRRGELHRAAGLSVWAHLRKLRADGSAGADDPDDPGSRWWATPASR